MYQSTFDNCIKSKGGIPNKASIKNIFQKCTRDVGMAVPEPQKLGVVMEVCRKDGAYKHYTNSPLLYLQGLRSFCQTINFITEHICSAQLQKHSTLHQLMLFLDNILRSFKESVQTDADTWLSESLLMALHTMNS